MANVLKLQDYGIRQLEADYIILDLGGGTNQANY